MRRIVYLACIQLVFLAACGGGSGGNIVGGGGTIPASGDNVAQIVVDAGPPSTIGTFNTPYVTVIVCVPGSTTNCQTIDHIDVDTGSYGLRIVASVLNTQFLAALPQESDAIVHNPIVECTKFADGFAWGSIRTADVHISKEVAANVPIQVIGDPGFPNIPPACSSAGRAENTVATFGSNGILGVGPFVQDCGGGCVNSMATGLYYICPQGGTTCNQTTVTLAQQVANPVASFATDNNGVIIELPSIPDAGAMTVTGSIVFGIDTQSNNGLGKAVVLTTDPNVGNITVTYKGAAFPNSFIDSGSNLNFVNDSSIPLCATNTTAAGFFCPNAELNLTASNSGANNVTSAVSFNIANANTIFNNNMTFTAFNNLAAPNTADPQSFDYGLPFFFGRNVFTAIEARNTSGGMGPYFAY
ncbi:MAG: hypothetical protein JWN85_1437 [Gammaproteobacteria bacterium]|nr:hypothetical protein [Gammaproteobacteria bacterium]